MDGGGYCGPDEKFTDIGTLPIQTPLLPVSCVKTQNVNKIILSNLY